jgi:hypothetical protein
LILLAIVIVSMATYRAKRKAEFKNDLKSALKSIDEKQTAPTTPAPNSSENETRAPKAGWKTYTNVKSSLPASLQSNFIAFTFDYPNSFIVQPQSDVNFVKVEKYASAGKGNTAENFTVGFAWFDPPNAPSDVLYEKVLDQLGQQLSASFHRYNETKRTPLTVDGVASRALLFQAELNDPANRTIYGKTIVVHPPGKDNGVAILILGTSLSRDIKSADDLGTTGETADILRSFRFL